MYDVSVQSDYIQAERLKLNVLFPPRSVPGYHDISLEVTINCSKPEFVPGAPVVPQPLGPNAQCVLCYENVGFKPGLRAFELLLNNRPFFIQYPPYPYTGSSTLVALVGLGHILTSLGPYPCLENMYVT